MNDYAAFRRLSAISAIVSAPLALGASAVLAMTLGGDPEVMANPARMLTLGEGVARTFRLVEFTGLFGYYLLPIPAMLFLWYWLRDRSPYRVSLYTLFGLGHVLVGASGSTITFALLPSLMSAYPQVAQAQREVLMVVFQALMDGVVAGFFPVSSILAGLWWLGIGATLRIERRILGAVTILLGIVSLGYGFGASLQIEALAILEAFTFFGPIWVLWLGVIILRQGEKSEQSVEPALAS